MKKIILALLILLAAPLVNAQVMITQVLYDSALSESDTEYVELYNQGDMAVDISGWKLNTTSIQATVPDGTTVSANSYFLIGDEDDSGAWPANWQKPDFEDEITLTNSGGGVQLVDSSGTKVDAVGWGSPNPGLYESTAHPGVSEGQSLTRALDNGSYVDTDDNSVDFAAQSPNPHNSNHTQQQDSSSEITLHASVTGNGPAITTLFITPDEAEDEGIQVYPSPGQTKQVLIQAEVEDADDDVSLVEAQLSFGTYEMQFVEQINTTTALYEVTLDLNFYQDPGSYNVVVTATDTQALEGSVNSSLEYMSLMAFEVDTNQVLFSGSSGTISELLGDLDMATTASPTIKNLGNTALDFSVSGQDLESGFDSIPVSNVQYTFLDNDYGSELAGTLSHSSELKNVQLAFGENQLRELTMKFSIPLGVSIGDYVGTFYLQGVES